MAEYFKNKFALTEKGSKDLVKAIFACTLTNLSFMFPVGLLYLVLEALIGKYFGNENNVQPVAVYIGISLVLLAVIYIFERFQYNATFLASYEETANKRISIAERMRKIPLSFFGKRDLADLTTTIMGDCAGLETAFSHYIPELFGSIISVALVGIGLLVFNWKLAIALLWVVPVSFIITAAGKNLQKKMNKRNENSKLQCAEGIQECIENVREIKANNQQKSYLTNIDEKINKLEKINMTSELNTAKFVVTSQMLLKVGIATMTLVAAVLLPKGEVDFVTFLMFLIAASRVFDPLSVNLQNLAAIYSTEIKTDRMKAIENHPIQSGKNDVNYSNFDIKFDHVKFAYENGETVLGDASFTAKQGEVTALVGPSGGGKSTAAKLAARFWDVNGGKITVGGRDISDIEPEELLKNYSIVFQDVVLFNNTIMENIRLGRKGATDEEVVFAAKMACCDDFIKKLPDGYHTMIGENGSTLSGGERQRLSIARAILKNAPIVLLDEATASLDVENESKVQMAISRLIKNRTVLVIAHKLRTVADADNIVVLADGVVKEQGTHEELLNQNGLYNRLWTLQTKSEDWTI